MNKLDETAGSLRKIADALSYHGAYVDHEIKAMASGLTDVILNIEKFVDENKGHSTDSSLRDAMNLCASMLGACSELRERKRDEHYS